LDEHCFEPMNYQQHVYAGADQALPPANSMLKFPHVPQDPRRLALVPSMYSLNMSFGYRTGDMPAKESI
jgi:hypothetical protein